MSVMFVFLLLLDLVKRLEIPGLEMLGPVVGLRQFVITVAIHHGRGGWIGGVDAVLGGVGLFECRDAAVDPLSACTHGGSSGTVGTVGAASATMLCSVAC
jgi:hypothetical protein